MSERGSEHFHRSADPEEAALVAGLARRDHRAVSDFLERTHRPVFAMTARLTRDPDLRHDWTQEILLRILDEMASGRFVYRWPGCFWSWFGKRCHFLLINLYHGHRRETRRMGPAEIGQEVIENMALPAGTDPAKLVEDIEARRIVEECLAGLDNPDHRLALTRVLLFGDSYQDVADLTGTTLNTVRSWVRRARGSVRGCIEKRYGKSRRIG